MTKEVKDVAEVVSNEKYYLPGETFDKMAERIGMFMGLAEKEYELMFFWGTKFTDLIKNKKSNAIPLSSLKFHRSLSSLVKYAGILSIIF